MWQAVKDLAQGGTTVLLTTQQLEEAERLADRIGILHEGRIIVDGTIGEIKALCLQPGSSTSRSSRASRRSTSQSSATTAELNES